MLLGILIKTWITYQLYLSLDQLYKNDSEIKKLKKILKDSYSIMHKELNYITKEIK